jgi:hypothetical protein
MGGSGETRPTPLLGTFLSSGPVSHCSRLARVAARRERHRGAEELERKYVVKDLQEEDRPRASTFRRLADKEHEEDVPEDAGPSRKRPVSSAKRTIRKNRDVGMEGRGEGGGGREGGSEGQKADVLTR